MTTRANDEAISGGRSPPSNQTSNINQGQSSSTTHQTISTQVYIGSLRPLLLWFMGFLFYDNGYKSQLLWT